MFFTFGQKSAGVNIDLVLPTLVSPEEKYDNNKTNDSDKDDDNRQGRSRASCDRNTTKKERKISQLLLHSPRKERKVSMKLTNCDKLVL